jgi:hypothetical protein
MQFKRIFLTTIYTAFLLLAGANQAAACGVEVEMSCCAKAEGACCSVEMNCCIDSNEDEQAPNEHGAPATTTVEFLFDVAESSTITDFLGETEITTVTLFNKNKAPPPKIYLLIHSLLFYDENVSLDLA